jgi:transcription elongation factor Elf1
MADQKFKASKRTYKCPECGHAVEIPKGVGVSLYANLNDLLFDQCRACEAKHALPKQPWRNK